MNIQVYELFKIFAHVLINTEKKRIQAKHKVVKLKDIITQLLTMATEISTAWAEATIRHEELFQQFNFYHLLTWVPLFTYVVEGQALLRLSKHP